MNVMNIYECFYCCTLFCSDVQLVAGRAKVILCIKYYVLDKNDKNSYEYFYGFFVLLIISNSLLDEQKQSLFILYFVFVLVILCRDCILMTITKGSFIHNYF